MCRVSFQNKFEKLVHLVLLFKKNKKDYGGLISNSNKEKSVSLLKLELCQKNG